MTTSYAEIFDVFQQQSTNNGQSSAAVGYSKLAISADLDSVEYQEFHNISTTNWDGDLTDVSNVELAFNMTELGTTTSEVLSNENKGRTGDIMAITLQGDILSAEKRAFKCRHSSWVSLAAQSASRLHAQARDEGIIKRSIQGYVENILKMTKDER